MDGSADCVLSMALHVWVRFGCRTLLCICPACHPVLGEMASRMDTRQPLQMVRADCFPFRDGHLLVDPAPQSLPHCPADVWVRSPPICYRTRCKANLVAGLDAPARLVDEAIANQSFRCPSP